MKNISKLKKFAEIYLKDPRFLKYLVVGFGAYLIDIGVNILLTSILNLESKETEIVTANAISIPTSIIFNFTMSRLWTFESKNPQKGKEMLKFFSIHFFNFVFTSIAIIVALEVNKWMELNIRDEFIQAGGKIFFASAMVLSNFYLYKKWVFKDNKSGIVN